MTIKCSFNNKNSHYVSFKMNQFVSGEDNLAKDFETAQK